MTETSNSEVKSDTAAQHHGGINMRLFISINFDDDMIDTLSSMQDELMQSGIEGSYTRPENMHMTLAFIGEYDDPEGIIDIMRSIPFKSFNLKVTDCSPFKDMFFANIEDNDNLRDFVKRLRHALSDNEVPFDRKKFMPHITLVRKAKHVKSDAFISEIRGDETMRVKGVSLMKSERGKHGMIYTEVGYVMAF